MSVKVVRPGLLTSIQDLGRTGFQKYGVVVSGAMDPFSLRVANLLVGNEESEGALETTLIGPELEFESDRLIAICGGNLQPFIASQAVPMWRPIWVKRGNVLKFKEAVSGCRAYIAVSGGFQIPEIMGSKSTYLRARTGGYMGRTLKDGDTLPLLPPSDSALKTMRLLASESDSLELPFVAASWSVSTELFPSYDRHPIVRVIRGRQYDDFTDESKAKFFSDGFTVTPQSDRMGYRLEGPAVKRTYSAELISEAVAFGSIQVPADGNPIILLADRQTAGGYPKIADVVTIDLPVLAQVKPGDSIHFQDVSLQEAQRLYVHRESNIQLLKLAISMKE